MSHTDSFQITIIGAGTIGLSFAALHLKHASPRSLRLVIHDTRPDLEEYILKTLPTYIQCTIRRLDGSDVGTFSVEAEDETLRHELTTNRDLQSAVTRADIVQEQGPEDVSFKTQLWPKVEQYCPSQALLWSSTSGIPASTQSRDMKDASRLIVVHPYNPPHIMPLLEIVPSPKTSPNIVSRTVEFWKDKDRTPIIVKKETTGFVANRLAFALLREAIHLVKEEVVTVEEIDALMTSSMGPRWATAGVFKSYHAGGGAGGLERFFQTIGSTVQACWDDSGQVNLGDGWENDICSQAKSAYGAIGLKERDEKTRKVLAAANSLGI